MHTMTSTRPAALTTEEEAEVAARAAEVAARMRALTVRTETVKVEAQERFDTDGLPRGLMPLSHL